jgi:site-specific DNA-cytosine methylase
MADQESHGRSSSKDDGELSDDCDGEYTNHAAAVAKLTEAVYIVTSRMLSTSRFGWPQNRDRFYYLCFNKASHYYGMDSFGRELAPDKLAAVGEAVFDMVEALTSCVPATDVTGLLLPDWESTCDQTEKGVNWIKA